MKNTSSFIIQRLMAIMAATVLTAGCAVQRVTRTPVTRVPALNTVTFDNKSGRPALVKLVGRKTTWVAVPNATSETVVAAAGHYFIKVQYGVDPDYSYSRGDKFDVTQTPASVSRITITLHPVVNGNYRTRLISKAEFDDDRGVVMTQTAQ